ncbi:MAG: histidine kinase, partial [Niveispirillum sp.]|nr:histidine kinase [Niveispirillum sp.]
FVADGAAIPPPSPSHPGVPGWFVALIWDGAPDILLPAPGGQWLLRADPVDEVAEVWSDTVALAWTALVMLALLLVALYVLVGRALTPLHGFAQALDRLAQGQAADTPTGDGIPELSAIGQRIARLDRELTVARAENAALSHSLIALQDQERAQLARDLHDELGPMLFGIRVDAHAITRAAGAGPVPAGDATARADAIANAAAGIRDLSRRILNRLRPMGLDHLHAADILRDLMDGLARRHTGIRFTASLDDDAFARSEAADLTLYRIANEALLNALRHGKPTHVSLSIEGDDQGVILRVTDNGGGLGDDAPPGHGIIGMRERVRALGGDFTILTDDAGLTLVQATLPVPLSSPQTQEHHG